MVRFRLEMVIQKCGKKAVKSVKQMKILTNTEEHKEEIYALGSDDISRLQLLKETTSKYRSNSIEKKFGKNRTR